MLGGAAASAGRAYAAFEINYSAGGRADPAWAGSNPIGNILAVPGHPASADLNALWKFMAGHKPSDLRMAEGNKLADLLHGEHGVERR